MVAQPSLPTTHFRIIRSTVLYGLDDLSLAESFRICPICRTPNHQNAQICATCGASLANVPITSRSSAKPMPTPDYDFRYGETDLLEGSLARPAQRFAMLFGVTAALALVGIGLLLVPRMMQNGNMPASIPENTPAQFSTELPAIGPTVTLGPPTATASFTPSMTFTPSITPTPEPCRQEIPPGGNLMQAMLNCGHRSQDVLPLILELNDLENANSIQANQVIFIPWPTPTRDPNAPPTSTPTPFSVGMAGEAAGEDVDSSLLEVDFSIDPFAPTATPTLPPGIQWHRVGQGENIIGIAVQYNADVKVLSELNPQIDFARCEFGERFGGPDCLVQLGAGQLVRVPAPTPTPTLSPTPNPNATATPTPTATFNVPNPVSPADQTVFAADQIVTLRWQPSASLYPDEAYRVDVVNETSGESFTALTLDIAFTLPDAWQSQSAGRFVYSWTVSIVDQDNPQDARHPTAPRRFAWEGLAVDG